VTGTPIFKKRLKKVPQTVQRLWHSQAPIVGSLDEHTLNMSKHMGGWRLLWLCEEYCAAYLEIDGENIWVDICHKDSLPLIL
jgi:hypothetical protein